MNYTPYAHLTAKELSNHIATMDNPTDVEVEAMVKIDELLGRIEGLEMGMSLQEVADKLGLKT